MSQRHRVALLLLVDSSAVSQEQPTPASARLTPHSVSLRLPQVVFGLTRGTI